MPPKGVPQPNDADRQMFGDWLAKLKYLSQKDPGPFVIRRLTKTEYGNTLHDLFGVEPSIADGLPDEVSGEGYLNSLSPLQLEQYLKIADKVLKPEAIAPPGGVTVAFVAQRLALASARPRACICATPRSQRDVRSTCRSRARRPRSTRASAAALGEPKPPGATICGLLSMKLGLASAKPPACICGAPRSQRDIRPAWRWWR